MSSSRLSVIAAVILTTSIATRARADGPELAPAAQVKLPDRPGSVRGLGSSATIAAPSAQVEYSVPIDVPTTAGVAPSVGLRYRGDLGNGPVGIGWSLSTSVIRRSVRAGVPRFDDSDELEIEGVASGRLFRIADGTYRVEGAGNTVRVIRAGNRWVVLDANGSVHHFGATEGSRQEAAVDGVVRTTAWYPELTTHLSGRVVRYRYVRDRGQLYLSQATWGPSDRYRVELEHEPRPDALPSYRDGFEVVAALRVRSIRVRAAGEELRAYRLRYDESLAVSRLAEVSMTGRGGAGMLPALRFSYVPRGGGEVLAVSGTDGWHLGTRGVTLFDVDGDGADDLLRVEAGGHAFRKNLGGRFGPSQSITGAAGLDLGEVSLIDVDGDARGDLVRVVDGTWRVSRMDAAQRAWIDAVTWAGTRGVSPHDDSVVVDLNGDARMDVVQGATAGLTVRLGGPGGLESALARPPISAADPTVVPGASNVRWVDVNGDGLTDVVWITDAWMKYFLGRGDGTFVAWRRAFYPWGTAALRPRELLLLDLDRDGLTDLVRVTAGHVLFYPGRAHGFGGAYAVTRPDAIDADALVTTGDVDGDGAADLLWSSPRGIWTLDLAGDTNAGMLATIDNGLGQLTRFTYAASAHLSIASATGGQPWARELPVSIPVPVRSEVAVSDGPVRVELWSVRDGHWDAAERRFAGFLETRRIVPATSAGSAQVTIARHHPGDGAERALRGRTTWTRIENGLGAGLTESSTEWVVAPVAGLDEPRLGRAVALTTLTRHLEGAGAPIVTATRLEVDAEGRIVEEYSAGRLDRSGDERRITRRYASDDTLWVRDRVCEETVWPGDGDVPLASTRHYFGPPGGPAFPLCTVGPGLERRLEAWLAEEGRWVVRAETTFDERWNPVLVRGSGVERALAYDPLGLYVEVERIAPGTPSEQVHHMVWDPVQDLPIRVTGPDGIPTHAAYDALGRLESLATGSRPPHVIHSYEWTAPRPMTRTRSYGGAASDVAEPPPDFVAGSGWRESAVVSDGAGESLYGATRASASTWLISGWIERDERGRAVLGADDFSWSGTDPRLVSLPSAATVHRAHYDAYDRRIERTLPTGAVERVAHAAFTVTVTADARAPVTSILDGQGRVVRTERTIGGDLQSVDAVYDALGQITSLELQRGTPSSVLLSYSYDSLGRLRHASDPDIGDRWVEYDDADRVRTRINGVGEEVTYEYDAAGRVTSVATSDGPRFVYHHDRARTPSVFHNTAGRLAWVEEPTGAVEIGYDDAGRASHLRRTVNGQVADEVSTYSSSGDLLEVDFRDGFSVDIEYDDAGRAVRVGDLWTLLDQDAAGRVLAERFGNGLVQRYERDAVGQLDRVRIERSGTSIYDVVVDHDLAGAITGVSDVDEHGLDHSAAFTYDAAGRLVSATLGAPEGGTTIGLSYAYDALQNMTARHVTTPAALGVQLGAYRYGEALVPGGPARGPRQLTSVAHPDGSGPLALDYDAAGRQTRQGALTLDYNGLDQLVRVSGLPGGDLTHGYGYDGMRVWTLDPAGSTQLWFTPGITQIDGRREHYVRLGQRLIARVSLEWTGDPGDASTGAAVGLAPIAPGTLALASALAILGLLLLRSRRARPARWRFVGALGATSLFLGCGLLGRSESTLWSASETIYFHQGLGAGPSMITRADGSILEERRHEPFGAPVDAYRDGGAIGPVDFAVEQHNIHNQPTDPSTGWSYHGARWMAPETARWLTPDPPVKAPDPGFMARPWALHPYQYVEQNPVQFWDPDGKDIYFVIRTNDREIDRKAAATRVSTIHSRASFDFTTDAVYDLYVPDLGKLKETVESILANVPKEYGWTIELSVFGHSGPVDGPVGDHRTSGPYAQGKNQLSRAGWAAIDFRWHPNAYAFFYGCRTMPWVERIWAKAQPRVAWSAGNIGWSFPSHTPHANRWNDGDERTARKVYFVGTGARYWVERKLASFLDGLPIIGDVTHPFESMHAISKDGAIRRVEHDVWSQPYVNEDVPGSTSLDVKYGTMPILTW